MGYTKEDVLRIAKEKDVKFIRLQFTDIFGQLKNVAITASQLEKALDNECMFDGSSIEGFVRINTIRSLYFLGRTELHALSATFIALTAILRSSAIRETFLKR